MALTNMEGRRPNLVSKIERIVERERSEGEKKKKRRRREAMITKVWNYMVLYGTLNFVWNYDLYHGFYEIMYDFPCLYD